MNKYKHFTKDDRNELAILLKKDYFQKDIAEILRKNPSSISREIRENSVNGEYDPVKAHRKAMVKRLQSKYRGMKIRQHFELEDYVQKKMKKYWTPEEIAGRWNKKNKKDRKCLDASGKPITITAVSIYKYLYGSYGQHLCKYLLSKGYSPKPRKDSNKGKKENIPNLVSVHERPGDAGKKFGNYEGDTLGKIKSDTEVIAGVREKLSRYLILKKLSGLKHTVDGFKVMLNPHQSTLKSLTLDRGLENVRHEEIGTNTYFCDPYSSWQKGGIENDFKRLRRFIPKGSSLRNYTDKDILYYNELMNNTPRKCLNWNTPKEVFERMQSLKTNQSELHLGI